MGVVDIRSSTYFIFFDVGGFIRHSSVNSSLPVVHLLKVEMPAKSTMDLLRRLRALMSNVDIVRYPLEAYVVGSQDAHWVSI